MKPYYEEPGIQIFHGDCRDILPHLPKVDLVLTDPPYGIGIEYGSICDTPEQIELYAQIILECRGLATVVSLTPGVTNMAYYERPTWVLCWFNRAGAGMNAWGFSCWQPILVYGKDPYLGAGLGARPDYIEWCEVSEKNGHPCPKPLGFVKQWMARVSLSGSIIDPFMGSGTTLRAAKDLGRQCIGIEIEEKYCELAVKRLNQEVLALEFP